MTYREKMKRNLIIALGILFMFGIVMIYNKSDKFKVTAEDAKSYNIAEAKMKKKEKLQDFDYLYNILEKKYTFFEVNQKLNNEDWLKNKRRYRKLIKNTKSDAEFFVAMQRILGELNDPNTHILSSEEFSRNYKAKFEELKREDALEYLAFYEALTSSYSMYRYQFNGDIENIELYEKPNLETKILEKDKTSYIKINAMAKGETLEEDMLKIKEFLKETKIYEKLIIDIRGNKGGSDNYWKNLVGTLTDKPLEASYYSLFKEGHRQDRNPYKVENARVIGELDKDILDKLSEDIKEEYEYYKKYDIKLEPLEDEGFKGKIYLLVDRDVTAQAENFASFAKDTGFAKLVGESTGGNRMLEETPLLELPNTKFVISYSRELSINKDGSLNMQSKTQADIEVDASIDEELNKDKTIEAVIKD
nr:S41 family peptidase [Tissierella sp.]